MYQPCDYFSSDEFSDDDDIEYFANKHGFKPTQLTETEQREKLLSSLMSYLQVGDEENAMKIINDNNLPVDGLVYQDWTPLIVAAASGHLNLTKTLIEKGADVNQTKDTNSVLIHACNISQFNKNYEKSIDIVKLLVENKCDVNYKNSKRMTAYLMAASNGNIDVIQYLRDFCDVDATDNQGWNALFHAVQGNHFRLVKFLLKTGMNYKKHDVRHNTPLTYARQHGFHKIENLMPDDVVKEKQYVTRIGECYDYKTELANPRFMRDVNIMLYGMNSASLLPKFQEDPSMNLHKFLTLTEPDLCAMGINKPYQLNRILGGLYEFHGYPFKYKSIPFGANNSVLSTYDIGCSMFGTLRHYITMQSTLKYLRLHVTDWDDKVLEDIKVMEKEVEQTKQLVKQLAKRCARWEKENLSVDLILYPSKPKKSKIIFFLPIVTAISIVIYFKYHV